MDLQRLFRLGDSRGTDLLAACRNKNADIATAAFMTLQFTADWQCEPCADVLFAKHNVVGTCGAKFNERDFARIDRWLAKKRTATIFNCGNADNPDPDEPEPLTRVDDAAIYGLILDGSKRSESLLGTMRSLERACTQDPDDWLHGHIVMHAEAYRAAAEAIGGTLTVEPDTIANSIRASAFYIEEQYRQKSDVEMLARNAKGDRILLVVSYHCGRLCGEGYYVVLQKEAHGWRYDVITMAWIS